MDKHLNRIHYFKGKPRAIGFAAGRALGPRLEQTISHYIAGLESSSDMAKLHEGALPWLRGLPQRFQEECEGLAEGANLPLQQLAEWQYIEECETRQCSGAVCLCGNHAWVARNNDTYVPELWGYALIREVDGRIPTIGFSIDLIRILADDEIERRESKLVTAYANVACPSTGEIWYTFGGYPAASKGNWQRLAWPWVA